MRAAQTMVCAIVEAQGEGSGEGEEITVPIFSSSPLNRRRLRFSGGGKTVEWGGRGGSGVCTRMWHECVELLSYEVTVPVAQWKFSETLGQTNTFKPCLFAPFAAFSPLVSTLLYYDYKYQS